MDTFVSLVKALRAHDLKAVVLCLMLLSGVSALIAPTQLPASTRTNKVSV